MSLVYEITIGTLSNVGSGTVDSSPVTGPSSTLPPAPTGQC